MSSKHGIRTYRDEIYPSVSLKRCDENIDDFFKFMFKRHQAWRNRFISKLPKEKWTDDKYLREFKYTNVYRQLDRGSLWALEIIIQPIMKKWKKAKTAYDKECHLKNLLWKLAFYRLCNRIDTFEDTGIPDFDNFDPVRVYKDLLKVWKKHSIMTSAHLTCPCNKGLTKAEGLTFGLMNLYFAMPSVVSRVSSANKPEDIQAALTSVRGIGGFTAYEVYCDLCYSGVIPWTTNDFVNIGPGATEGIRLLYPSATKKQTLDKIRILHSKQKKYFKRNGLRFRHYDKLEPVPGELSLRCVEHSLCEYSKYFLQKADRGKRRLKLDKDLASHPQCSINVDTGDTLVYDKETYDNFFAKSNHSAKTKSWTRFLKDEKFEIDDCFDFCVELKKRHNP